MGIFILILFVPFGFSESLTEVQPSQLETASVEKPESYFQACRGEQSPDPGARATSYTEINAIKIELFEKLFPFVQSESLANINTTRAFISCFSKKKKVTEKSSPSRCADLRNWVDPQANPLESGEGVEKEESLNHSLKEARFWLAASYRPKSGHRLTEVNWELEAGPSKPGRWSSMSDGERKRVQDYMDNTFKSFYEAYGTPETGSNWIEFRENLAKINSPHRSTRRKMKKQFSKAALDTLRKASRGLKRKRRQAYAMYLSYVSDPPIANYLTSGQAQDSEIVSAAQAMLPNAREELRGLNKHREHLRVVNYLNRKRPERQLSYKDLRPLLEYHGVVEKFLAEPGNSKYCEVATQEALQIEKSPNGLGAKAAAPLLAASIMLGPFGAMAVGAAAGVYTIGHRVVQSRETQRAANSASKEDVQRRNLQDVENASAAINDEVEDAALGVLTMGGVGKAGKSLKAIFTRKK